MTWVQLVVSRLAGVPGVGAAYHSSVLVDGAEFFFSDTGLMRVPARDPGCSEIASHAGIGSVTEVFDMGTSCRLERHLVKVLSPHFLPGTYDFLRKNCNSFSDCALTYLLGKRLEARYRQMDLLALSFHSSLPNFLQAASLGHYSPNPAADGFDLDATVHALAARSQPSAPAAAQRRDPKPPQFPGPPSEPFGSSTPRRSAEALQLVSWHSEVAAQVVQDMQLCCVQASSVCELEEPTQECGRLKELDDIVFSLDKPHPVGEAPISAWARQAYGSDASLVFAGL